LWIGIHKLVRSLPPRLEQPRQEPEEEAEERAADGGTGEPGEEARDELAYAGSDKVVPDETTYDGAYGLGVY
jgi:hypothetical protein